MSNSYLYYHFNIVPIYNNCKFVLNQTTETVWRQDRTKGFDEIPGLHVMKKDILEETL